MSAAYQSALRLWLKSLPNRQPERYVPSKQTSQLELDMGKHTDLPTAILRTAAWHSYEPPARHGE